MECRPFPRDGTVFGERIQTIQITTAVYELLFAVPGSGPSCRAHHMDHFIAFSRQPDMGGSIINSLMGKPRLRGTESLA